MWDRVTCGACLSGCVDALLQPTQLPTQMKAAGPQGHAGEAMGRPPTPSEHVIIIDGRLPGVNCTYCRRRHLGAGRAWHAKGCWRSPHRHCARRPTTVTALRGSMLVAAVMHVSAGTPELLRAHSSSHVTGLGDLWQDTGLPSLPPLQLWLPGQPWWSQPDPCCGCLHQGLRILSSCACLLGHCSKWRVRLDEVQLSTPAALVTVLSTARCASGSWSSRSMRARV